MAGKLARPDEDPKFSIVQKLLRESHYAEAQAVSEIILQDTPDSARAKFYLGLSLHKQKKYAPAKPYLEQAAARSGEFYEGPHAIHFVGWCAYYLGDLAGARAAFELHQTRFPKYDNTLFGLGLVALDEDKLDEAEQCFLKAIELLEAQGGLARERAKNYARLGDVALRREQLPAAEAHLRKALELWKDHYEAWSKLARVLDRQQRPADAAEARVQGEAAFARLSAEGIPWRP